MKKEYILPYTIRCVCALGIAIKKILINYIFFIAIILLYIFRSVPDNLFIINTYLGVLGSAYLGLLISMYDIFRGGKKFIFSSTLFIFIILILFFGYFLFNTGKIDNDKMNNLFYAFYVCSIIYFIYELILSYYDKKIEMIFFDKISEIDYGNGKIEETPNEKKNSMVSDVASLVSDNKKE